MNEPRIIEGVWRIFGDDKSEFFGVLQFVPEEGIELTVRIPTREIDYPAPDVIHGRDGEGNPITLFGFGMRSPEISTELTTYKGRALRVLIGNNFSSWADATFNSASFDFSLLFNWLNDSQIIEGYDTANRPCFTVEAGKEISVSLDSSAQLKILTSLDPDLNANAAKYCINRNRHVQVQLERPIAGGDFISEYAVPFRNLLTLFADTAVYIDRIEFLKPSSAELLMASSRISSANRKKPGDYMLVPYKEVATELPQIIKRWYEYKKQLDPVLNLYFSTVFNTELYGSHKFLFLAQALEVYHRDCRGNFSSEAEPTANFRKRREAIFAKVSPEEKAWLESKLHYANQKVLAVRLKEILAKHGEVAAIIPNHDEFVGTVMNTRHYYTHFGDQKDKGKIAPLPELGILIARMRTLLQICILKDLGITGYPIQRLIDKHANIKFISI